VLLGIIAILLTAVFFILRSFISTILASFVIAYLFHPLYRWTKKWLRKDWLAAGFICVIIILLFAAPVFFVTNAISNEARTTYVFVKKILATGEITGEDCVEGPVCAFFDKVEQLLESPQLNFQLTNLTQKITDFFLSSASSFVLTIPVFLLHFFIMIFIVFYLFIEGELIVYKIRNLIPLKHSHRKSIFKQLSDVTYAVVYGQILVSAIQALIGGIAFWIFGVTAPILWAFVMFFFALIPFLGTPVVWVPAVIIKAAQNEPGSAIGILIVGIIISTADNFIKPKIVSNKAKVHPVLVLLGVIGGLSVFGPIGIIIGPVVLSIFMVFIQIYEEERET